MSEFQSDSGALERGRIPALYNPLIRRLWPTILEVAAAWPVAPELLVSLCWLESGFELDALAPDGGEGLLSMTPALAHTLAPELGLPARPCLQNPAVGLRLGACHLVRLFRTFDSHSLALLAWHLGVTVVEQGGHALLSVPEHAVWLARLLSTLSWVCQARPWQRPVGTRERQLKTHAAESLSRWLGEEARP